MKLKELFIGIWTEYLKPVLKARELEQKIMLLEKEIYEQKMLIKKLQTQLAKLKGDNREEEEKLCQKYINEIATFVENIMKEEEKSIVHTNAQTNLKMRIGNLLKIIKTNYQK